MTIKPLDDLTDDAAIALALISGVEFDPPNDSYRLWHVFRGDEHTMVTGWTKAEAARKYLAKVTT